MPEAWLHCIRCGSDYALEARFFGCPACANGEERQPLEVQYAARDLQRDKVAPGIWAWRNLLPPVPENSRITLHEGNTPCLPMPHHDAHVEVFLKNETSNPTWSWKDRPNSVSISVARHFGFRQVVAKSTGNHGNAVAAYSSAGGLGSTIFCHPDAPDLQLALMKGYGARVVLGGNQDALIHDMVRDGTWFPSTIFSGRAGYTNPFGVEGFKTIAFEIVEQLGGPPDRVFVSVGSGDGIYGIYKGFRELAERGLTQSVPRMVACQAEGANSLVRAWRANQGGIQPLARANTVALSVSEAVTGDQALKALYDSGGIAVSASDAQIVESQRRLQLLGLALEPSSALAVFCADRLARDEPRRNGTAERWVVIGSGAAVKWPESLLAGYRRPYPLKA